MFTTALLAGFVLMGYEIFGSRVLSPYFGSSTHVWGALIAVFMAGLCAGYAVGGKIADRFSGYLPLSILLLLPGCLLLCFPIYGQAFCKTADKLNYDERIETMIASLLLFFLPSAFIGAVSPYLVTMKTTSLDQIGTGNGSIYALVTFGSIIGTLFSSFYLVGRVESSQAIALFGVILLINGTGSLFLYFLREKSTLIE